MNPQSYAHLIFEKGTKNILWRKTYSGEKAVSSTNVAGIYGYLPAEN
jgi:hypothetical protein